MKDLNSLKQLIEILEEFPSIGRKSATRLAINLAKDKFRAFKLANAIEEVARKVNECKKCGSFSEYEICEVCDSHREKIVAIVDDKKDVLTIEDNGIYDGYYFVMEKLNDENLNKLKNFIKEKEIKEVIFAFSPSVENEAKILYLQDKLKNLNIAFSQIAQGIPTGVKFENVDITSLAKAIKKRVKI